MCDYMCLECTIPAFILFFYYDKRDSKTALIIRDHMLNLFISSVVKILNMRYWASYLHMILPLETVVMHLN